VDWGLRGILFLLSEDRRGGDWAGLRAYVRWSAAVACLVAFFAAFVSLDLCAWGQEVPVTAGTESAGSVSAASEIQAAATADAAEADLAEMAKRLRSWDGKPVLRIEFQGVSESRLEPLPGQLAQQAHAPLNGEKLRESLRRLYATGLYDSVGVEGRLEPNGSAPNSGDSAGDTGVVLIFRGVPSTFVGVVTVDGAKGGNTNVLLVRASRLTPGTRFVPASLAQAELEMKRSLAENGFREPELTYTLTPHPENQLVDIAWKVNSGPQAKTGTVEMTGDSGLTREEFLHYSKLKPGRPVNQETDNRALSGLVDHYRKTQRLEAEVKLESQDYLPATKVIDYKFSANRGPIIRVVVDGVKLSDGRVRRLVPVYEEGAVDEDLLNEGSSRLQNYYQRLGYFDVKVRHDPTPVAAEGAAPPASVEIVYHVVLGSRHRVEKVSITGQKYFALGTLQERLNVRAHDAFDRQGVYNQSLVSADVASLMAIYQNNGFSKVKVTPEIHDADDAVVGRPVPAGKAKQVDLTVTYQIDEGQQQRVHSVEIVGAERIAAAANGQKLLLRMLNTAPGQPLSPESLAGDRETLITYYLSKGFDQVHVELSQAPQPTDQSQVDVTFKIREGEQVFVRQVLTTGLHYTREDTLARGITIYQGDPLDETALIETQRNLYDLALFNEVNPVIQNPAGQDTRKTVLLQTTEARRWDISYGGGFEVQTGTVNGSTNSNPNGTVGASPRGLLNVSRINLFGRDQSASLLGTLGLLEQRVNLLYQYPRLRGNRNFSLSLTGGYNNSQDVVTYSASKLEVGVRLAEHFYGEFAALSKANTFVYQLIFRRVKVNAGSIQVPAYEVSLDSQAVRVGGPAFTWIRDTRDAPLDAHRGTYTSFQEFVSTSFFSSQANFNQVDVSNSSYYEFDHGRAVLARNTRYGQERAYGNPQDELIPLPERLYGGGANSHRGFGINSAGPRDPQTGYPIGGAGTFINSTELRMPPPTLPYVGNTMSFVLFHDMGNVFTNASDIWPSALRFRQQDRAGCRNLSTTVVGPVTSTGQQGTCTFNYFSHALGLGLRYHTPVGPIRVDFSWNLNPPIYPVTYDAVAKSYLAKPYVGEGSHFNFFFSLGQSF
jgi:outer membrane protein assembly complex protein YaeT